MKRLGPELRMPDLKGVKEMGAPAWLTDLYYDMRDRRLLPLVALVVVAIAAVPFLLGDSEVEVPPPLAGDVVAGESADGIDAATLTVVEATPGLRDYRKRLKRHSPTDPFAQKFAPPTGGGGSGEAGDSASGGGGGSGSGGSTLEIEVSDEGDKSFPVPSPGGGGGGGGGNDGNDEAAPPPGTDGRRYFAYRPNVRFGVAGSGKLREHEHLEAGSLLPERNPAIVFLGVSEDGKRAAFDVSPEVQMVKTAGRCIGGPQSCGTLILKAGQAATLATGKPNRNFRLKITRIDFVEVFRGPKKPAGSSKRETRIGFGSAQSFSK